MPSDTQYVLSVRSHVKMMMHCMKYPHSTVNGLLLASSSSSSPPPESSAGEGSRIEIVDVIPLFHLGHGLSPMLEVALLQVRLNDKIQGICPLIIIILISSLSFLSLWFLPMILWLHLFLHLFRFILSTFIFDLCHSHLLFLRVSHSFLSIAFLWFCLLSLLSWLEFHTLLFCDLNPKLRSEENYRHAVFTVRVNYAAWIKRQVKETNFLTELLLID